MKRLFTEPLVPFIALGALIFGLHATLVANPRRIDVSAADVERLRALAARQWGREPDPAQTDALVQGFVREEVLYREAVTQGMARDDEVVRRRLAQKMEFVAQGGVRVPSDDEVGSFYAEHAADYA